MATPVVLQHVHIGGVIPFKQAQILQSALVNRLLAHKASSSPPSPSSSSRRPEPYPTILTFTPEPVYTFGRRDPFESIPETLKASLREERFARRGSRSKKRSQMATLEPTLRGGQTTFHGPGSLVIYPIFDLKSPFIRDPHTSQYKHEERHKIAPIHPQGLDVRTYVEILEQTTIELLKSWEISGVRTQNPGVWVEEPPEPSDKPWEFPVAEYKKIAAVGLHLRRNITSFGTALNVHPDLGWFDRITACGLEGLGTTSIREINARKARAIRDPKSGLNSLIGDWSHTDEWLEILGDNWIRQLAVNWVEIFADRLWGEASPQILRRVRVSRLGLDLDNLNDGGFWKDRISEESGAWKRASVT